MLHTLQNIFIYPIKSCGGIELSQSLLGPRGLQYDRRYMLIDEMGVFISQRKFPKMSLIKLKMDDNGFLASFSENDNHREIQIPFYTTTGDIIAASVWDDNFEVLLCDQAISNFFSEALEAPVRLVYLPDSSNRFFDLPNQFQFGITSLADAYPLLLIGTASLDALNSKLDEPIDMDRFRPNLIVCTDTPNEEDLFGEFSIGNQKFVAVKQCSRCIMTTIDQKTGIIGKEPLKTLSTYRSFQNKIMFGMNVTAKPEFHSVVVGEKFIF